jgi:hypothetical protein
VIEGEAARHVAGHDLDRPVRVAQQVAFVGVGLGGYGLGGR